jgi:hypothetical protein
MPPSAQALSSFRTYRRRNGTGILHWLDNAFSFRALVAEPTARIEGDAFLSADAMTRGAGHAPRQPEGFRSINPPLVEDVVMK